MPEVKVLHTIRHASTLLSWRGGAAPRTAQCAAWIAGRVIISLP